MTPQLPVPSPPSRCLTARQVAARLGRSVTWFHDHKRELLVAGFPACDPLLGKYDAAAVERWLDRRSGIESESEAAAAEARMLASLENESGSDAHAR